MNERTGRATAHYCSYDFSSVLNSDDSFVESWRAVRQHYPSPHTYYTIHRIYYVIYRYFIIFTFRSVRCHPSTLPLAPHTWALIGPCSSACSYHQKKGHKEKSAIENWNATVKLNTVVVAKQKLRILEVFVCNQNQTHMVHLQPLQPEKLFVCKTVFSGKQQQMRGCDRKKAAEIKPWA